MNSEHKHRPDRAGKLCKDSLHYASTPQLATLESSTEVRSQEQLTFRNATKPTEDSVGTAESPERK